MKIEKITDNKIRIIVNQEELLDNNLDINDFISNTSNSQKFFLKILNTAEKECNFDTKNCKLLIETFPSIDEIFVFTITKFSSINEKNPVYEFNSFDDFCFLCNALKKLHIPLTGIAKKIALYSYNDTYYLVFLDLSLEYKYLKKLFIILCDYASPIKNKASFEAKLAEYGKIIIKHNALKTGVKYF